MLVITYNIVKCKHKVVKKVSIYVYECIDEVNTIHKQ